MPDLPPLHARVKITAGGYAGDFATVTDRYTRWDGVRIVEVKTDSGMPLLYGPVHLEEVCTVILAASNVLVIPAMAEA